MIAILVTRCGCMRQVVIQAALRYLVMPLESYKDCFIFDNKEEIETVLVDRRVFEFTGRQFEYAIYKEVNK